MENPGIFNCGKSAAKWYDEQNAKADAAESAAA
jgi:hypothetical protein